MSYFEDINIIGTFQMETSRNNKPLRVDIGSIGVMCDSAIRILDGKRDKYETPFVYWSIPGRICAWQTLPGEIRKNTWFTATGERFQRILSALHKLSDKDLLPCSEPTSFLLLMKRMEQLKTAYDLKAKSQGALVVLVEQFVAEIYTLAKAGNNSGRLYQQITELVGKIRAFPAEKYDFQAIAAELGISYDHFRVRFREYCGYPPHEFCLAARFDAAVAMLSYDEKDIKEIAWRCGFENASDFARFFKKRGGCSPSAYRRSFHA